MSCNYFHSQFIRSDLHKNVKNKWIKLIYRNIIHILQLQSDTRMVLRYFFSLLTILLANGEQSKSSQREGIYIVWKTKQREQSTKKWGTILVYLVSFFITKFFFYDPCWMRPTLEHHSHSLAQIKPCEKRNLKSTKISVRIV